MIFRKNMKNPYLPVNRTQPLTPHLRAAAVHYADVLAVRHGCRVLGLSFLGRTRHIPIITNTTITFRSVLPHSNLQFCNLCAHISAPGSLLGSVHSYHHHFGSADSGRSTSPRVIAPRSQPMILTRLSEVEGLVVLATITHRIMILSTTSNFTSFYAPA